MTTPEAELADLRALTERVGGTLREFAPIPGEPAYVVLRTAECELIGRSGSRGGDRDTVQQAAQNLAQLLCRASERPAESAAAGAPTHYSPHPDNEARAIEHLENALAAATDDGAAIDLVMGELERAMARFNVEFASATPEECVAVAQWDAELAVAEPDSPCPSFQSRGGVRRPCCLEANHDGDHDFTPHDG